MCVCVSSSNLPQKIFQHPSHWVQNPTETWPGNSHHIHDVTGGVDPVGQAANQLVHLFGNLFRGSASGNQQATFPGRIDLKQFAMEHG